MDSNLIKSMAFTFVTTIFCIWLLYPMALQIGLTDNPGGRKQHKSSTPLIGGIAIFFGFCFGLLTLHIPLSEYRGLIAGAALLLLMGVVDDIKEVSQKLRLFGQLLAALLMIIWGNKQLAFLGDILFSGNIVLGLWSLPLSIVIILCYINAFNMIDGQDGLAGGVGLTQLGLITVSLYQQGLLTASYVLLVAVAAVIAFLYFNIPLPWRKSAKIFMGDSGSTVLAFIIIWFALQLSQVGINKFEPINAVWFISYPVFDLIQVFLHRLIHGKSPLEAGREHLHHILITSGMSASKSVFVIWAISLGLGLFGILLHYLPLSSSLVFIIWLLCLLLYVALCNVHLKKHVDTNY